MANELALGGGYDGAGAGDGGWGADIVIGPSGDFIVLVDTPDDPAASEQRLLRIIMTNPIGFDDFGNAISRPDDIFNPWFGSGARNAIGKRLTPTLATTLQNNISAAIAADPNFITAPAPIVQAYVDQTGDGQILLFVQATTVQGAIVVLPSQPLQFF